MRCSGAVVGNAVEAAPGVGVVEGVAVQVGLATALPDMLVAGVKVALSQDMEKSLMRDSVFSRAPL